MPTVTLVIVDLKLFIFIIIIISNHKMFSLPLFNLQEFDQEMSDSQEYSGIELNIDQFPMTEITHSTNRLGFSMENVGNNRNSSSNQDCYFFKPKEDQNIVIEVEKSFKSEYTQTLAVFQRIYSKIVSSYLGQISSPERKTSKKLIYFDKCEVFKSLQVQSSFTTLKQVINRCELEFSQKCQFVTFLDTHQQLRAFLTYSLSYGYEEINNQFIYFLLNLIQEVEPIVFKQSERSLNSGSSISLDEKENEYEEADNLEKQKLMKKHLQDVSFFERIFYQKTIKFLNCHQLTPAVSDQKVKQAFIRFARLYSHLIIKLIIMDGCALEARNSFALIKKMNSCEDRMSDYKKQNVQSRQNNTNQIFENWFSNNSNTGIIKSFNSINSLGSINLNNLNDIKIYSSINDIWSEDESEKQESQQEETGSRQKIN